MAPKLVANLILRKGREVLLYKRINTWYEEGNYGFPGGNVDAGESPLEAAIREAEEEVRVVVRPQDIVPVSVISSTVNGVSYESHYFAAQVWEGEVQNREPDRCGGLLWAPMNNLPPNTIVFAREALSKLDNA